MKYESFLTYIYMAALKFEKKYHPSANNGCQNHTTKFFVRWLIGLLNKHPKD